MKSPIGWILSAGLLLGAGCVVDEPPYYWEDPPGVVEVEPGIWVVPNWHTQVFYSDGWYWTYYEGRWYRGAGRRGWRVVEVRQVPPRVVAVPSGRYVQWHPPPPAAHPVGPAAVHPVAPPAHTVGPAVREERHEEHREHEHP